MFSSRDFIKDPETEIQVNIESDANTRKDQDVATQDETTEEEEFEQPQPQSTLPDSENPLVAVAIDWDSDQNWQTRFWARIMDERRQRQQELLLLGQKRQELEIERQQIAQIRSNIDQQKRELEVRQNKMIDYESLIPPARELRNCGITLELILPYLSAINEKAVAENIDLKTSANNLVNDIQEYRQLGTLQNTIKRLKEQLSVLDTFNTQKQHAIMTLMNLQLAGLSEKDINELIGLVTAWNKSDIWGLGFGQSNGKLDDKLIGIGH